MVKYAILCKKVRFAKKNHNFEKKIYHVMQFYENNGLK